MLNQSFYSNGKLLLTAEYLVLDGAKALALPTKFGQDLQIQKIETSHLIWESYDENNLLWFSCIFDVSNLIRLTENNNENIAKTLQQILLEAQKMDPSFLREKNGYHVKTKLNFPRNWGLGTSSTLINNIAQWAQIDAFKLLKNSFGGSGYDIACAQNDIAITYQIKSNKQIVTPINFDPDFKDQLYFVHLNKKQNSKEGIAHYKSMISNKIDYVKEITQLTNAVLSCSTILEFEMILSEHEKIIGSILQQKPVQKMLFSDYFGQTKSLGAWGGDFILATGNKSTPNYFKKKGFPIVIPYQKMILCSKK
jgi:mevalonate kinase